MPGISRLMRLVFILSAVAWFAACGSSGDFVAPTVYAIGDRGPAGGIVFHTTAGGSQGLEAATVDQSVSAQWGCSGTLVGAAGSRIGDGAPNTADILAGCMETPIAADIATGYTLNGHSDWFLPSRGELLEMRANIGFISDTYWSSTEFAATGAEVVDVNAGSAQQGKSALFAVRAVRAF